jgi:hypothetical protein
VNIKSGKVRCGPVQGFAPGSVDEMKQMKTLKGKLIRCNSMRKISLLAIGEEEHELGNLLIL